MLNNNDTDPLSKWVALAGKQLSLHLGQKLAAIGVSTSQYYYILKIHDNPGLTQKELITAEFMNPSNVTRAVKQLVNQGLVRRERSASDKRAQTLQLTAAGKALYPQIRSILDQEELDISAAARQVTPDFDADQFTTILQVISRLY